MFALFLSVAAVAQRPALNNRQHTGIRKGQITRFERFQLHRDAVGYRALVRRTHRDGRVTPMERARLHKMKESNRRDHYRYRNNGRKKII